MEKNNCKDPLKLTYNPQLFVGYKVNKPDDQTGEYVDKAIADDLLEALEGILAITDRNHVAWHKAHAAIKKAYGL